MKIVVMLALATALLGCASRSSSSTDPKSDDQNPKLWPEYVPGFGEADCYADGRGETHCFPRR